MGFRYRKSINCGGGFRINLSKSGIGYSWGVKGYRITKTATGKTLKTHSIPGTGISWQEEDKNKKHQSENSQDVMIDIDSAEIGRFQAVEYSTIIEQITKALKADRVFNIFLCLTLLSSAFPLFFVFTIVGIVGKIFLLSKKIALVYEMDSKTEEEYKQRTAAWMSLNRCHKMWQITQHATTSNRKINAGASRTIARKKLKLSNRVPYYLKPNVAVVVLPLSKEKLILLPDMILLIRNKEVGAVSYKDFNIDVKVTRFIETEGVPNDSEVLNYVWQYINKDGSPDRRYKNNWQLPVCLYADIHLSSSEGLNVEIQCSNIAVVKEFSRSCIVGLEE